MIPTIFFIFHVSVERVYRGNPYLEPGIANVFFLIFISDDIEPGTNGSRQIFGKLF
jgi:hypothetical protein